MPLNFSDILKGIAGNAVGFANDAMDKTVGKFVPYQTGFPAPEQNAGKFQQPVVPQQQQVAPQQQAPIAYQQAQDAVRQLTQTGVSNGNQQEETKKEDKAKRNRTAANAISGILAGAAGPGGLRGIEVAMEMMPTVKAMASEANDSEKKDEAAPDVETVGSQKAKEERDRAAKSASEEARIMSEAQANVLRDMNGEIDTEINGLAPNRKIKDEYAQKHPLSMFRSTVPYLADDATAEQQKDLANRFGFENYEDYSKYVTDLTEMRDIDAGRSGIASTKNLLEAPIYSAPGFKDTRDEILKNIDQQQKDLDNKESEAKGQPTEEALTEAALGGIYGDLTASDWDNMTQRQQFMWALANDENLRNQLAGINEGFASDDAIGDFDEATRNYSGNAYELYRTLDRDQLEQAVNAVYGLWDDDDSTGLRGWGDYTYGDLASNMDAAAIAAYMIDNGLDRGQYLSGNANYDYNGLLGTDQVTAERMIEYLLNEGADGEPLSRVFYEGNQDQDLASLNLDTTDLALALLAEYQNRYGYIGNEDPVSDLNYLMALGGENNLFRSTGEDDDSGRRKDYSQRRSYDLLPALNNAAGQVQGATDANGNPVGAYMLDINPWFEGQGDNPLVDAYLSDTFAAQYADKYKGKQLVQ